MRDDAAAERLHEVQQRIAEAAARSGRSSSDVLLVAVSKSFPLDAIERVRSAGATDFGENRAQELKEKVSVLGTKVRWHFIGNLQTNKVRLVVGSVVLVHSVDRFGLAEAISQRSSERGFEQDVLIEVNASGEASKHGVEPASVMRLADEVAALPGIRLRGLMTMAPFSQDPDASRPYYVALRSLSEVLRGRYPDAIELSMGMSQDFEAAIDEGATIVRVGQRIFGPRGVRP